MAAPQRTAPLSVVAAANDSHTRYLPGVEIRILGPVQALDGGEPMTLGGMRERSLLALLALSPGQTLSSDHIIDQLWGEDLPANPANALQALVSRLRRAVGAEAIVTQAPGYVLDVEPGAVDAMQFRTLVETAADEVDPASRSEKYRAALALWRGAPLAEFPFEEFAQRDRAALEELHLLAVEARISADLESGGGGELVPELEDLITAYPLRESLRASQMLALYRAGRQAEALRAYTAAREVLGEELGIEPGPELRALEESILMQDPELRAAATAAPRRSTLPARLASFIGRDTEMVDVAAAFATSRLVTLTGSGGAGKTSLAIEVGRTLEDEYLDGVYLVELAPVVDPARVADAAVTALQLEQVIGFGSSVGHNVDSVATIVEYLRSRRVLLILDNCEHVVEAAAALAETVLLACPAVEVMATSRDRLGIPGELLWRVPSLDTAPAAVDLFVERARAVLPSFAPDPKEVALIADICARVDGMPLAIELAAARVRSLPIAEISRRLETDIGVLSGGPRSATHRQQTLRGTIDWSYQLLALQEADLFASLSVFHGSFALDAAEAAASPKVDDVLASLERLIDSSMVTPIAAGRYRMLETLRVYAGEKLADQTDATMARLLAYFTDAMAPAQDALRGPDQIEWLNRIEADQATMRSLLDWAVTHAADDGLKLAGMLGWFWYLRGSSVEARERFAGLLDKASPDADLRFRGDAHFFHSLYDPTPHYAGPGFEAARELYQEAGYVPGVANANAMIAAFGFETAETIALLDDTAAMAAGVGYEWGVALIRFLQVGVASNGHDIAAAARLSHEATSRFASLGDSWGQGYSLYFSGSILRQLGEYERAEAAFREALDHARPMRLRREMAPVMSELASMAMNRGDFEQAERWLAEAQRYADEVPFAGSQGMVRNARGRMARLRGDLVEAERLHQEARDLYADEDAHGGLAYSRSCLGFTAEMAGDLDVARAHHLAALQNARETGDVFAIALGLEGIGGVLIAQGENERGIELIHAGLAARDGAGAPLPQGEWFDVDRALQAATAALGGDAVAEAEAKGAAMGLDAATELALSLATD
jgi:predicted ATPase/DNA-binding SARP family transcriptional activator